MFLTDSAPNVIDEAGVQKPIPAAIFVSNRTSQLRVGGLSLLDRLIVGIHRAGAGPITLISDGPLPMLKRTAALGIRVEVSAAAPALEGPVLVATSDVLAQTGDLRRCLEARARLMSQDGAVLPVGVAGSIGSDPHVQLIGVPELEARGVAMLVESESDARRAERILWASLTSSSDGWVDRAFNRPCGRPISKFLIHTPVSPNAVSITSVLIGVVAAIFFAMGTQTAAMTGAVLFQLSAIIDCVDGDIARMVFKESRLGKWIDIVGDQVVHVSVFGGIAMGVYRSGSDSTALALGAAAIAGAVISFAVILRGMRVAHGGSGLLQRLIDSATNRDFSVLVMFLAVIGKLELFLWLSALGSHAFWMTALGLQLSSWRRAR